MERSDHELLRAWVDGDEDAGNALVRRHFSAVFRFFRSKLEENVDDLTQKTFLACVGAAATFRGDGSFRAFLLGIARKQLLMHLRTRYRREQVFDPAAHSIQEIEPGTGTSPTGVIAERENEKLLLAALRRIPIDFQIAVELFYWEELPLLEIAEVLEIAEGTVKSRLGRARVMLRDEIAALATTEDLRRTTADDLEQWAKALRERFSLR